MTAASAALLYPTNGRWLLAESPANVSRVQNNDLHSRAEYSTGDGTMSDRSAAAKVHPLSRATFLSEDEIREHVAAALNDVGGSRKELAREANTTPVAVKNWAEGRNTMSLSAFVQMARGN